MPSNPLARRASSRGGGGGGGLAVKGLLPAAYFFCLVSVVAQLVIFIAGTWLSNADPNSPGPMRLGLSKFAIASFDGFIPDHGDQHTYLVTAHLFPTSFGWEYPTAGSKAKSAGIVAPTYDNTLSLPRDFVPIGQALELDPSSWDCFPPNWGPSCASPFYAAFRRQFPYDNAPGTAVLLSAGIAFLMGLVVIPVVELLIAVRPHWLRCQCPGAALRRICPCPRGGPREIALLPSSFWDRYRLWIWPVLPVCWGLVMLQLVSSGYMMLDWLRWAPDADEAFKVELHPRIGRGFLTASWVSLASGVLASFCIFVRLLLAQRANWMEQMERAALAGGLSGPDPDDVVGLEGEPSSASGGRVYSDVERPSAL